MMDENDRKIIYDLLCRIQTIPLTRVFFGEKAPLPADKRNVGYHSIPRIFLPLSGEKNILFAENGTLMNHDFVPGEILFTHHYGWTREFWRKKHEFLCAVFYERFIRFIFLNCDGSGVQPQPKFFFHTHIPLESSGVYLLKSILKKNQDCRSVHHSIFALLALLEESLRKKQSTLSKQDYEWDLLQSYLLENFTTPLTKDVLAEQTQLHPKKITRFFRSRLNMTFSEYLTDLRLEEAARELRETSMTVDEISQNCGFAYTSYFIRCFRKKFGESPLVYRNDLP